MATSEAAGSIGSRLQTKTIVIKIGTSSLITETDALDSSQPPITNLNLKQIAAVVETCCKLRYQGHNVVLVSSGAVGTGRHCLGYSEKPKCAATSQALAAVGQVHLMSQYESFFSTMSCRCAQVLITYHTFRWRKHYMRAETTFTELFRMGIIPVVNENDTIPTQDSRSENDTMAAMVASLVSADHLFLLTDVPGLFTANPKTDPSAKLITYVDDMKQIEGIFGDKENDESVGSSWGTGGMRVKLNAASLASSVGIESTIMASFDVEQILDVISCEDISQSTVGTTFARARVPPSKRKRWIRGLHCTGSIVLNAAGVECAKSRETIYCFNVTKVLGKFPVTSPVKIVDGDGQEIGNGLTSYSSDDLRLILGKTQNELSDLDLASDHSDGAVIYRKNMAVDFPLPEQDNVSVKLETKTKWKKNFFTNFED